MSAEQNSGYNLKSLTVISSTDQFFCSVKKPDDCRILFSEIISYQWDVIESITNHFTCMKIGHVKTVSELLYCNFLVE